MLIICGRLPLLVLLFWGGVGFVSTNDVLSLLLLIHIIIIITTHCCHICLSLHMYMYKHTYIHMYCSLFIICKCHQPPKTRKLWGYKRITGWACVSIALHLVAYSQRVNVTMKRRFKCVGKIYRVAFLSFFYTLHYRIVQGSMSLCSSL